MKVAILWTFLLIVNAQASPLAGENSRCPYDDCVGQKFICATNGKDYQVFRNVCYLQRFNWCNRECEIKNKFLQNFQITFFVNSTAFRKATKAESRKCIDYSK